MSKKKADVDAAAQALAMYANHPLLPPNSEGLIVVRDEKVNEGEFVLHMDNGPIKLDLEKPKLLTRGQRVLIARYCFACWCIRTIEDKKLPEQMRSPAPAIWGDGWLAWSLGQAQYHVWLQKIIEAV